MCYDITPWHSKVVWNVVVLVVARIGGVSVAITVLWRTRGGLSGIFVPREETTKATGLLLGRS